MDKPYRMVGQSQALKYVLFKAEQVASTDAPVLILGEKGVGKEHVARVVHAASGRKDCPFVKLNCAALPAHLVEAELFGREPGAFADMRASRTGRLELSRQGTLFLDEVEKLPAALQPRLLRVMESGEFERQGGARTFKVNVRVISATSLDLKTEVERGHFRADLWHRLNVYPITIPPLRRRQEDIPLLVDFFVNRFNRQAGKSVRFVPPDALRALRDYDWPGNVRELAQVIERAVIAARGTELCLAERLGTAPAGAEHPAPEYLLT
ncbi:MAG: sigma 54-interacting transcriptional regulator [Pyrinomonadaceae bacterium]